MGRAKKTPKIGCFAKSDAAVMDLRVTEQGKEVEVRAGGGKMDFGFISSMNRNQNSSE